MMTRVLIIGGYGTFGQLIARQLARDEAIQLIIAGRDKSRAIALIGKLDAKNWPGAIVLDINQGLKEALFDIRPDVVIHTSGPYQGQGYLVARACIEWGCHYIDLADGRDFVAGISSLHKAAKERGVLVCAGASSVPGLSSAVIDEYKDQFKKLDTLEYGIAVAQLSNRGLATTSAVLSYAGKSFKTLINGQMQSIYGWLGLQSRRFWGLNNRLLGNCDIPDLELFPSFYPDLQNIRFQAGLGVKILHIFLWMFSALARYKLFPTLEPLARHFLKISYLFDCFGSGDSGFYMKLSGSAKDGSPKFIVFELVARDGDGLNIPIMPAALITRKLAHGQISATGAFPCIGFVTLEEYLRGLREFQITWRTRR
jgi:hypothetical protein